MAVSEAERQHLYQTLTNTLGQQDADTLMNLTPSTDVSNLATNDRLDATNARIDATNDRLDATNARIDALDEKLTGMINAIDDKFTGRFVAIDDRFDAVSARFDILDRRMAQLVTRDEFAEMKADLTRSLSTLIVASYVGVTAIFSTILAIFV